MSTTTTPSQDTTDLFPGLETHRISLPSPAPHSNNDETSFDEPIEIFCRRHVPTSLAQGDDKRDVLLFIHGHPQTHHIWHRVVARLLQTERGRKCEMVIVDTRGMGESSKPPITDANGRSNYTKRKCADDLVAVMRHFGHTTFSVVSHDRGARIAHRMLIDHGTSVVSSAIILDIAPTLDMYNLADQRFGMLYWHWFFLPQPSPLPETFLVASPDAYLGRLTNLGHFDKTSSSGAAGGENEMFHPTALAAYRANVAGREAAAAMCEDYRASAPGGEDLQHDEADRKQGRKIEQPLRLLWGQRGVIQLLYGGGMELWKQLCADGEKQVNGRAAPCGHYVPEEGPEEVVREVWAMMGWE